ncbi:MAG TPA: hypothetical protein VKU00_20005 [Chthonomonadaceae bacterium]|nr:hypothetical protein [Chthonomonadaceae bacterium]
MKIPGSLLTCLLACVTLLQPAERALAGPPETRASHLGAVAVGMGQSMHMSDFLQTYPESRTAILCYLKLDSEQVDEMVEYLRMQADVQERMGREFWPQIALETHELSLAAFNKALSLPGSQVDRSVRTLARAIARYRNRKKWFFIRPFSEMNDATEGCPWEFGSKTQANTPEDFATAWILLREAFNDEGATNAIFVFSPLAAHQVHRESQVLATLNLIPKGYIDAFGLNVYSRPRLAYGGDSQEPISFAELAQPWMNLLAGSRHRGIPLAVPEMGISNQASDERRAKWLRDAFGFARANGFVLVTYFNYPHRYWQIDEQTLAAEALRGEMSPLTGSQHISSP